LLHKNTIACPGQHLIAVKRIDYYRVDKIRLAARFNPHLTTVVTARHSALAIREIHRIWQNPVIAFREIRILPKTGYTRTNTNF